MYNTLCRRAAARQSAPASRSEANYVRAASIFLAFMMISGVFVPTLTHIDLIVYIEYLDMFYAPATVPIYLSHAKAYMQLAGLSYQPFYHLMVNKALRSVSKDKSYQSKATLPLSMYQFNHVLASIPNTVNLITYLFAYSIMLVCAWRRSSTQPILCGQPVPYNDTTIANQRSPTATTCVHRLGENHYGPPFSISMAGRRSQGRPPN